jgi:hypothetical protein
MPFPRTFARTKLDKGLSYTGIGSAALVVLTLVAPAMQKGDSLDSLGAGLEAAVAECLKPSWGIAVLILGAGAVVAAAVLTRKAVRANRRQSRPAMHAFYECGRSRKVLLCNMLRPFAKRAQTPVAGLGRIITFLVAGSG